MSLLVKALRPKRTDTLENPATSLAKGAKFLYDAWGGAMSASGQAVNAKTAPTVSTVYRAVSLISGTVAKLPLITYKRTGPDARERATRHPAYRLLKVQASDGLHAFYFWRLTMCVALLRGNAYAYIFRRGDGTPYDLTPLPGGSTWPVKRNGQQWYILDLDGRQRLLRAENVIHVRGPGDTLQGWSLVDKAKNSLGLGIAQQTYAAKFFANGAMPLVTLEHPKTLNDDTAEALRKRWNSIHQGIDNAHRTAILEEGMKANVLSLSHRDLQFLESRAFEVREVANWFGLPPHKLGDSSRTSYNSLEAENQAFLDECLDPWLCAIEAECYSKLLTERQKERDSHYVEFVREALLRADIQARNNAYRTAVEGGWLTRNEVRVRENHPPADGLDGFLVSRNFDVVGEKPPPDEDQPDDDTTGPDDDANPQDGEQPASDELPPPGGRAAPQMIDVAVDMLADAADRMLRRTCHRLSRAQKNGQVEQFLADELPADRDLFAEALAVPLRGVNLAAQTDLTPGELADALVETVRAAVPRQQMLDYTGAGRHFIDRVLQEHF